MTEARLAPGRVACRLATGAQHANIQGVVHGAVTMALLDTAMGHALDSLLAQGEFCSTTQFSLQYLRAARPGEVLEAEGRVTHRGRRIAYLEGECHNASGEVVARAHGTWYVGRRDGA
jgi:acyl-CoA thioesterase